MSHEIWILSLTAASLSFFHTLCGPDHYLRFLGGPLHLTGTF
jgi:hypothetical protein